MVFPEVNLPRALKISSLKLESFASNENFWKSHSLNSHRLPPTHQVHGSGKVAEEGKLVWSGHVLNYLLRSLQ